MAGMKKSKKPEICFAPTSLVSIFALFFSATETELMSWLTAYHYLKLKTDS